MNRAPHASQRGMVVIIALFMVAIVAAMSYAMLGSLMRDTQRTSMLLTDLSLSYHAEGGIAWAKDLLMTNWQNQSKDLRVDKMPIVSPVDVQGAYRIVTRVSDAQSRYNINRLADSAKSDRKDEFLRLLSALNVHLEQKQQDALIEAIKDWLTQTEGRPDLDRYYDARPVPYRAAHQPMTHISELRLVKGMTDKLYTALSPYLIALPPNDTRINIFTASPHVLVTLGAEVTLDKAMTISKAVAAIQTNDPKRVQELPILKNLAGLSENAFTVVSDYFLVETSVSVESQQLVIYTLLERKKVNDNKVNVNVIWQSKGIA